MIFVNDGSTDRSWQIITELSHKDQRLKGLSLSRNFGHHIAITAGLDHARGEAVMVMDGDLQDPPEEIPKLYEEFKKGYDLVYGTRKLRQDNYFRRMCSSLFWKTIKALTGFNISGNQSMLRIMSRRYVDNLIKFPERSRWLPGLYAWAGFDQTTIPIEHAARFSGTTKYNLLKMLKLTFNAITSFSSTPLQVSGMTGLALSLMAFIYATWLVIKKIFLGIPVTGWASLMVAILLIGGFQLIMLWLVGQYLTRVFTEVQGRPLYIVKETTDAFGE
jgi:dolichol-phosphate mannosyltransferase